MLTFIFSIICFLLILMHGLNDYSIFKKIKFRVDAITISLLVLSTLPFAGLYIKEVDAGNVRIAFNELSTLEQEFVFLNGIAERDYWTYYKPRKKEHSLGAAFSFIVKDMLAKDKNRTHRLFEEYLESNKPKKIWFACENIGYFKIKEFEDRLKKVYSTPDIDQNLKVHELNCFWALSRIEENRYDSLHDFLKKTTSESNQSWILEVYEQMPIYNNDQHNQFITAVDEFLKRGDISKDIRQKAQDVREYLKSKPLAEAKKSNDSP